MPRVTHIQRQKQRDDWYSVFVDGNYSFSLSANDLLASGLRQGQELSDGELQALSGASQVSKAYDRALGYVSIRRRTRQEIGDYLRRKGYDEPTCAAAIERLEKLQLIDDAAFAQSWVATRQALKPRSRRRLAQELAQKGTGKEVIDSTLAEVGSEQEQDAIRTLVQKKSGQARYQNREVLLRYLVGQGFSYQDIKQVLEEDGG